MAAASSFKNMVLCLSLTCLVCSGLLGGVYALTKEPIEKTNAKLLEASVAKVLPEGGEISAAQPLEVGGQASEYYTLTKDGQVAAYAVRSTTSGFGGALTLMVGITADGLVYNTSVLSHSETPGLGAKCTTDAAFMEQWKGFDPATKVCKVKKDQGSIDAITASTITSRAYALAVANAIEAAKPMLNSKPVEEQTNE